MRVAIISPAGVNGRGGIERFVKYLVEAIEESSNPDISCEVVATRTNALPILKHFSTVFVAIRFFLLCATNRFDILHINVAPDGSTWRKAIFAQIGRWYSIPTLLHLHGSAYDEFFEQQSPRRQTIIRSLFQNAASVAVMGEFWKNFVQSTLLVPEFKIRIIANGVPAVDRPVSATPNGTIHFVTLGMLGERKGTDVFLKALSTLPGDLHWRATVAGNGEVEKYRRLADALSLDQKVDFPGWVEEREAGELLQAADIFVLPSRAENQPIAILEAMARGLPVISTAVGAIPDQVADGINGLVVEPGNAEALERAMTRIATEAPLRTEMGRQSRIIFERRFSIRNCAAAFAQEYRALNRARK